MTAVRPWVLLTLFAGLASLVLGGCSSSHPTTPTPSGGPLVVLSVAPIPVPIYVMASGPAMPSTVQTRARIVIRESAGAAGTLNHLDVDFVSAGGQVLTRSITVAWPLAPSGDVTQALEIEAVISQGLEPTRVRVRASGADASGRAFAASPAEAPASIVNGSTSSGEVVLAAAGDIALCDTPAAAETARLLDALPGPVLSLGDHVYPTGSADNFARCYDPTWGRYRSRTFPAPGNHDWEVDAGAPYFAYFGATAGLPGLGYYSYDLSGWHVLSLNSNVEAGPGSPQYEWARSDLRTHAARCTLAYWHHPVFSSGPNGNNRRMAPLWTLLQENGAEVILTGHDHEYERFAPQNASGLPDPAGLRQFVVGTGGAALYQPAGRQPNSEVLESAWGVLKLTLRGEGYSWDFLPIAGQTFRDSGSAACH